jgi:hypothetical protein
VVRDLEIILLILASLRGDAYGKSGALDLECGLRCVRRRYGCCMLLGSETVMRGERASDEFGGSTARAWDV